MNTHLTCIVLVACVNTSVLAAISGCLPDKGSNSTTQSLGAATDKLSGNANATAKNCLAIVGGQATGAFPEVFNIVTVTPGTNTAKITCTGTFIGDNAMITASHCIPSTGVNNIVVLGNGQSVPHSAADVMRGARPLKVFVDPARTTSANGQLGASASATTANQTYLNDIAVLLFADNTATSALALATSPVDVNTVGTVVGYGRIDLSVPTAAVIGKNYGNNVIGRPPVGEKLETMYLVTGWGHQGEAAAHGQATATIAEGDSGGPLIVNNQIVGVAVGVAEDKDQSTPSVVAGQAHDALNVFVDVTQQVAKDVIARAVAAGAHLATATPLSATAPSGTQDVACK